MKDSDLLRLIAKTGSVFIREDQGSELITLAKQLESRSLLYKRTSNKGVEWLITERGKQEIEKQDNQ